uniref:Adenosine 5'-monophosphoramidase HINT3 n=1 Tax=Parastrongyloides trichosuri TaxID=131310 RepID=A0A0N4ZT11_PARTI
MDVVDGCVFCNLLQTDKEKVLKETDDLAIVKDIKPHAKHHYLVLSKKHIGKIDDVRASDIDFIKQMESVGREYLRYALKAKGEADIVEDMLRIGFHQSPFLTVKHLHMHVLYPISSMGIITRHVVFRPGRFFKPVTEVLVEMQDELLKSDNKSPAAQEMKAQHKASIDPTKLADAITGK